jgi:phosphate starvation-inducible membrane PsiE
VIANFHVAIAVLLILTLFFSLGGMIGSRFKNWFYVILFFCCSLVIGGIVWYIVDDFKKDSAFLSPIKNLSSNKKAITL